MQPAEKLSITLPAEMARLIRQKVSSGAYGSTSEVIRTALRGWIEYEKRLKALDDAIAEGISDAKAGRVHSIDDVRATLRVATETSPASRMNVIFTQRARDDLLSIQQYIGQHNPERAESFVEATRPLLRFSKDGDGVPSGAALRTLWNSASLAPRLSHFLSDRRRPNRGHSYLARRTGLLAAALP